MEDGCNGCEEFNPNTLTEKSDKNLLLGFVKYIWDTDFNRQGLGFDYYVNKYIETIQNK